MKARALATAAVLLASTGARGDGAPDFGGDYRVDSRAWNGLATLVAAAGAAGCPVEERARVAWDRLEGRDVLWLIYPRTAVDAEALALFLDAGGRALIADDYGAADAALARLGITRRTSPAPAKHRFHERADLPEALAWADTPLGRATSTLPSNHPAWFETALAPTFRFAPGAAMVVEGRLGRGRFVALSDPSVLINNMQEIDEDRRFAAALVRSLCRPGVDRIVLATGALTGRPMAVLRGAPEGPAEPPASTVEAINRLAGELDEGLAGGDAGAGGAGSLIALSVGAALLGLGLLRRALPSRGAPDPGTWTRIGSAGAVGPVAGSAGARGPWRHTLPAALLREEAHLRLADALGRPIALLAPAEVAAAVAARFGDGAAAKAEALWVELSRLPAAGAPTGPLPGAPAPWTSRRELKRLHRLAVELFDALDEGAATERKVAGPGT